mgnify:CR=1 FL=1
MAFKYSDTIKSLLIAFLANKLLYYIFRLFFSSSEQQLSSSMKFYPKWPKELKIETWHDNFTNLIKTNIR